MNCFSNRSVDGRSHAPLLGLWALVALMALSAVTTPSADAAESSQAIADFSGYWDRPEPTGEVARFYAVRDGPAPVDFAEEAGVPRQGVMYIGDDTNPILMPHAAEAVRAQRDTYHRGEPIWSAWALCWPVGVPLAFSMVNAVQFLQTDDEVTIIYQRGQTVRRVYLNDTHPNDPAPSWFGHSVGHYEGADTLVIDTIAPDPRAVIDRFGTPKSEAMRVTERYTISPNGERIDLVFNVEDPLTFTTAWSATIGYAKMPPQSGEELEEAIFAEIICPENNRDVGGGYYSIPLAAQSDF